jgi:hypothetical protein
MSVAIAIAFDRAANLPAGLTKAAADVAADLVALAPGAHVVIAGGTADDFLRHALELLAGPLQFLFG